MQTESACIEFGETRSKRNEQIALPENILHGAETGDAAQRKQVIAGKHSLPAGGGKDRTLKKFSKLADNGCASAYARADKDGGRAASCNLLASVFYLLRQRRKMRSGILRCDV